MVRRAGIFVLSLFLLVNLTGCFALFAGAAGGTGTAIWLGGKMSQEVNATFEKSLRAARSGLKSLGLIVSKETVKYDVAQLISKHRDGRKIWIDVHRITQQASKIEVRVGMKNDEAATRRVLDRILRYL
ncbi:DUF3568 family protein [Candidatus Omnitrophota bacterium]